MMGGPLEGIRVLDASQGAQGPWAGALLADLGADVIKVERPEGDLMRGGREIALPHAGMNHGKRNIILDVKRPEDMETMLSLVRQTDVFLENWRRDVAGRLQLDYPTLSSVNPRIVYASASAFGEGGRYGPLAATDAFSQAMGGYYSLTGPEGGPPERPRTQVIDFTSPLTVVQAILMGLRIREQTRESQWVHCSQLRTLISLAAVRSAEYFASGEVPQPLGSASAYCVPSQAFGTADKYIIVDCPTEESWRALCGALDLPELADDPRFAANADRVAHRVELLAVLERAFLRYSAHRWLDRLRDAGVPCSHIVWDIEDLYDDPQIVANGLIVERTHPDISCPVRTNEVPWIFSSTRAVYGPLSGKMNEHAASVMADVHAATPSGANDTTREPSRVARGSGIQVASPLTGIRVVDLTEGDGAPFCTMQLGDAGADVVKVEPLGGDWARQLGPPFDCDDGPLLMGMNRSKRSIALDLKQEEGRAIVHELAQRADVFVHSFEHAADAARLGLNYHALSADNPGLVYCDISTLEREGPDADLPATDLTVQARSGLLRFVGLRGGPPVRYGSNWVGVTASLYAMQAILAALWSRDKTGLGQKVETSYLRAAIASQQNTLTAFSEPGADSGGLGTHLAPPAQGFATKDGRIELAFGYARDPEAGAKLLDWLGIRQKVYEAHPELAQRPIGARDQAALRPHITEEFKKYGNEELLSVLADLGLMFAPVHDYGTFYTDPGIIEQYVLTHVDHPVRGRLKQVSPPWQVDSAPTEIRLGPPQLGEHADMILAEIGYESAQVASLRSSGIVR